MCVCVCVYRRQIFKRMIFESDLVTRYNYDLINLILSPLIKLEQTRRRRRGKRRKEKEKEYLVINVSVQEHVIFYLDTILFVNHTGY